jgi:hypothetical protein
MPLGGFRQGELRELFTPPAENALVALKQDRKQFLVLQAWHLSNPAPLRVITA